MISTSKIIELTGKNTNRFKKIKLPNSDVFSQPTYFDVKKVELDYQRKLQESLESQSPFNEIINGQKNSLQDTYQSMEKVNENQQNEKEKRYLDQPDIDYESFIQFSENEKMKVPAILCNVFGNTLDSNHCYLYGHKNPDSFYKTILHLKEPDFIIKNKYEANQSILRIKKEVAFDFKNYWKNFKYNFITFEKSVTQDKTISNLLNKESYVDPIIIQSFCNYIKGNILVFNIVDKTFQMYYHQWETSNYQDADYETYLIIDYKGSYLPCLYVDNKHLFTQYHIDNIIKQYEWSNKNMYTQFKNTKKLVKKEDITDNIITTETTEENTNFELDVSILKSPADTNVEVEVEVDVKDTKVELTNVKDYKLKDLQQLAENNGISIKKEGAQGKMKNKTKQELYDELRELS